MTSNRHDADEAEIRIHLEAFAAATTSSELEAAKAKLVELAANRMRSLARRMLAGTPRVRRWIETDDVVQTALLRLHRALGAVALNDPQHFLRLAALQVRRELIDLTRRLTGPDSFARNHDTNAAWGGGQRIDDAVAHEADEPGHLAEWTRFHETVGTLAEKERELFEMVWYLGLSQDEIARLLDCSPRTVRRRWEDLKQTFTVAFRADPPE